MSGKQRLIVAALAVAAVTVFGLVAASVIQSLDQLAALTSSIATPSSQYIVEWTAWAPTLDSKRGPTVTRGHTRTPSPTRTPRPTLTPTSTPTPRPISSLPTLTPADSFAPTAPSGRRHATLEDFWAGRAEWAIQAHDVGLPVGESDTIYVESQFWAYLNASHQSAGIVDQCGDKVPFPGCVTLWKSYDGGYRFRLERPVCLFPCSACPCGPGDHVDQQQYPRVVFDQGRFYMAYEWGAGTFVRTSYNGTDWSGESQVFGTGIWYESRRSCSEAESINDHPNTAQGLTFDCLAGAPPGVYIEGNQLYVFVGLGQSPSHMGCFVGDKRAPVEEMRPCTHNPLFDGAGEYGPLDALGADADSYFDFRTISSADVVREGDHYYMAYEGTRGPSRKYSRDDQFALGFARSVGPAIDGPWEKHPGNPVIAHQGDDWGIGHADLIEVNGVIYLYTSTSPTTRGRYVLVYR